MKCPALLLDAGTGNCSHSKLLAITTVAGCLLVFMWANIMGREAIVGWEAAIGLALGSMANAQASKYLSSQTPPSTNTKQPPPPAPFSEETK
jgi:hypothetical protein